jgi:predicted AAA+ superfamily ATPase
MTKFKSYLKGIFDKEGVRPRLFVTGSARLDIAKKMGDSLAGRFFPYRLHPLDLWELREQEKTSSLEAKLKRLIECSGFPEPYLEGSQTYYDRWTRTHLDLILRQDLLDIDSIRNISAIQTPDSSASSSCWLKLIQPVFIIGLTKRSKDNSKLVNIIRKFLHYF